MKFEFIIIFLILKFLSITVFAGEWSDPVLIWDGTTEFGDMNFDKNDRLHLVFSGKENDTLKYDMFYTFYDGDSFAVPINISNSQRISDKAKLVVDNDNVIHAVWEDRCEFRACVPDLFYSYCKNGKWSIPMNFYHGDTSFTDMPGYLYISNLASDSSSRVHVMWDYSLDYYTYFENCTPADIQKSKGDIGYYHYLYIDNKDMLNRVSWHIELIPDSLSFYNGFFYYSKSDSTWSDPVMVYQNPDNLSSHFPKIIGDAHGRLHIVWLEDIDGNIFPDRVYHSFSDDGVSWTEPYIVYKSEQNCFRLDVAMDSQNKLHAVWDHTDQYNLLLIDHVYYSSFDGTSWSEPERLTPGGRIICGWPRIAVDSQDYLHVIWSGADSKLRYRTTRPSTNVVYQESSTPVYDFSLSQNFPNPFNTTTRIRFSIPSSEQISLVIYDISGKTVKKLLAGITLSPGIYEIMWDGTDSQGQRISSGIYFYRLQVESFTQTKKTLVLF